MEQAIKIEIRYQRNGTDFDLPSSIEFGWDLAAQAVASKTAHLESIGATVYSVKLTAKS